MYESLKLHSDDFHLYIFPFDDYALNVLSRMKLSHVTLIALQDFETKELLGVKKERTKAEYCWTCTPSIISFVLERYGIPSCTYIDADLLFYSDPSVLIDEMVANNRKVLITEHRFSLLPKLYSEKKGGKYCVQFLTFKNENDSIQVLDRWKYQCIDWCYAKYEDGKFGDQKYLEEWPILFNNIHILENQGGGLAPWNIQQYRINKDAKRFIGYLKRSKQQFDLVFYHFQYVKKLENNKFDIGWYRIPRNVKKLLYRPYLKQIREFEESLIKEDENYKQVLTKSKDDNYKNLFKIILKQIIGYNILKIK